MPDTVKPAYGGPRRDCPIVDSLSAEAKRRPVRNAVARDLFTDRSRRKDANGQAACRSGDPPRPAA